MNLEALNHISCKRSAPGAVKVGLNGPTCTALPSIAVAAAAAAKAAAIAAPSVSTTPAATLPAAVTAVAAGQGLTLVHLSAQRQRFV